MSPVYTIYALSDPRKPKHWKYVGATRHHLMVRLQGHCDVFRKWRLTRKDEWVKKIMLRGGQMPLITALETCDIDSVVETERKWIVKYKRQLLNERITARYTERNQKIFEQSKEWKEMVDGSEKMLKFRQNQVGVHARYVAEYNVREVARQNQTRAGMRKNAAIAKTLVQRMAA